MRVNLWRFAPRPPGVVPVPQGPPPLAAREQTLSDWDYHRRRQDGGDHEQQQQRQQARGEDAGAGGSGAARRQRKRKAARGRWSYVLQDIPEYVTGALNDANRGYTLRVVAVSGLGLGLWAALYYGVLAPMQERKPLAQRWWLVSRRVPITLVEKNREEGSNMFVYRFALPNSYDYAGYEPVSSVRLHSGQVRELSSLSRWYTPISHPQERGFVEFAIKDCDPGRMSSRLRFLEPGDVVYLGRWMKEFDYARVVKEAASGAGEMGLICSTAGASVALQLLNVMRHEPRETGTKLRLLYCHVSTQNIPFRRTFFDAYALTMPDRLTVKYNVMSLGAAGRKGATTESLELGRNCFVGQLDPEVLEAALPPPVCVRSTPDSHAGTLAYRPRILVCGPQSMMSYLCGRASPVSNYTYWQGWWFRYGGFMKDMGYDRTQVYKFGVSTHFLAIH